MSDEIKKSKGRPKKEKDYNSPFAERLRTLAGDRSNQEIADGIGVARQTVGQFMLGNTTPDIETLGKLADYFNVSTDYLLCKSDIKTANTDLKAICLYTGLSEEAVSALHDYSHNKLPLGADDLYFDMISKILSTWFFYDEVIGNIVTLNETEINFTPTEEEQKEAKELLSDEKIDTIHKGGRAIVTNNGYYKLMIESIKSDFGKIVEKIVKKRCKSHLDKDGKPLIENVHDRQHIHTCTV